MRTNMEVPDKIYVPQHLVAVGTIQELDELIVEGSVEYIRKEALLEFLTDLEKDSAKNAGTDDSASAAHEMVCQLIDKIKSL